MIGHRASRLCILIAWPRLTNFGFKDVFTFALALPLMGWTRHFDLLV